MEVRVGGRKLSYLGFCDNRRATRTHNTMPNYFTLTRKGETEPRSFHSIDTELCEHFNVPEEKYYWLAGWYGSIGSRMALGKALGSRELREDLEEVVEMFQQNVRPNVIDVLDYLEQHYYSDAGYCR